MVSHRKEKWKKGMWQQLKINKFIIQSVKSLSIKGSWQHDYIYFNVQQLFLHAMLFNSAMLFSHN